VNKLKYLFVFYSLFLFSVAHAKIPDFESFELDNGLKVVVSENHKAPIAKVMLFYKVGAMDEEVGKSGLAHLLEHLMFRGTTHVSASSFNDLMLQNGIDFNAFTSKDWTVYHALTDVSRIELVLALEADRMEHLIIDDEAFQTEQKIVYQERQQRIENNPKARFTEEMNKILWQDTPYEHPISGTLEEINTLTKKDALAFYEAYYTPNNAVLVISGDIKASQAKMLAEKYFGKIKNKKPFQKIQKIFSKQDSGEYVIKKQMYDVKTIQIKMSYIVPSVLDDEKTAYALLLFSSYLGESGHSYLTKKLIKTQKALSVRSNVDLFVRGKGEFKLSLLPLAQTDMSKNIKMLEDTMVEALCNLTPEILELEKKKVLSWLVYVKDDPSDMAHLLGIIASLGLDITRLEDYVVHILNVTLSDVQNAVQNMLKTSKKVTAVLMPKNEVSDE